MKIFLICYLTITPLLECVRSVQINYVQVPPAVQNNTQKPVILDCNYSVRPDDTDLVLKWFLNEEVVYQWIPPKKPQSLGRLKDRLDMNFTISNDPKTAFRAMKILNPTTDIAGEYKCFVSTFADEDFSERNMIVFEPEKAFLMIEGDADRHKVNFTCLASEVYPKPKLSLYRDKKDDIINRNPLEAIEWDTVKHEEDGRYTTFIISTAKLINLYPGDLIYCELRIPSTGYVKRRSIIYYPKDMSNWSCGNVLKTQFGFMTLQVIVKIISYF